MLRRYVHGLGIFLLIVSMTIFTTRPAARAASGEAAPAVDGTETAKPQEARDVAAEYQVENITKKAQGSEPQTTTSGSGRKTLIYGGIAAAAVVGAVALAAGSSGGGSSSTAEEEKTATAEPTKDPVGADLNGTNWVGSLTLADDGVREAITATVRQNGSDLEITTSTSKGYGRKFIGTIEEDAYIEVEDQDTGEIWSTHFDKARWNMIDLYDYVHNLQEFDRLYLERYSKE